MRMLDRRSQNKRRVAVSNEVDRCVGFVENGKGSCRHAAAQGQQRAFVNCRPCDCVSGRWFIAPVLAVPERDMQIVDPGRRTYGTRGAAELAEYDASRPF